MRMIFYKIIHVMIIISVFSSAYGFAADNFTITKSCGGGFTAKYGILSVNQDGLVFREVISYVDKRLNKEKRIVGQINSEDAKWLYSRLMQIGFENIQYSHPDNISCSLSLTADTRKHAVTWSGGTSCSNNIELPEIKYPEEIKPVLDVFCEMSKLLAPIINPITEKNRGSGH